MTAFPLRRTVGADSLRNRTWAEGDGRIELARKMISAPKPHSKKTFSGIC